MLLRITFGLLLLLFAYFQLNDPDPIFWVCIYVVAAIVCLVSIKYRTQFMLFLTIAIGLVFIGYSGYNWPEHWLGFDQTNPPNINVEKARESVGILLAATMMFVAVLTQRKKLL